MLRANYFAVFGYLPSDPDLCIRIFMRIRIKEVGMLRIQRIQILSTAKNLNFFIGNYLYEVYQDNNSLNFQKCHQRNFKQIHFFIDLIINCICLCKHHCFNLLLVFLKIFFYHKLKVTKFCDFSWTALQEKIKILSLY